MGWPNATEKLSFTTLENIAPHNFIFKLYIVLFVMFALTRNVMMKWQDKKGHKTRVFLCKYSIFPFARPGRCFCFDANLFMFQKSFLLLVTLLTLHKLRSARGKNGITTDKFCRMLIPKTLHVHFARFRNGHNYISFISKQYIVGELFSSQFC